MGLGVSTGFILKPRSRFRVFRVNPALPVFLMGWLPCFGVLRVLPALRFSGGAARVRPSWRGVFAGFPEAFGNLGRKARACERTPTHSLTVLLISTTVSNYYSSLACRRLGLSVDFARVGGLPGFLYKSVLATVQKPKPEAAGALGRFPCRTPWRGLP
jgi:hypothetical protein